MIFPYSFRLLCLCFAAFFVVHAVLGIFARFYFRAAIRRAATMRARFAARFLFLFRMFPVSLAALAVLALCVPSYLWLEPASAPERTGFLCIALAFLGLLSLSASLLRAARALVTSARYSRFVQRSGRQILAPASDSHLLVVEEKFPLLILTGILRPHFVISSCLLRELSPDELDASLRHEHAHLLSRDNLKRLLILLVPDLFPFVLASADLEHHWARFTEWAADDDATAGDTRRALSLAAALVRVARMGASPRVPTLHTALLADDQDFAARVDRLLSPQPSHLPRRTHPSALVLRAGFFIAASFAALFVLPATLSSVHRLLELFLR